MRTTTFCGVLVLLFQMLWTCGCDEEQSKSAAPPPAVTVSTPLIKDVLDFDEYPGRLMAIEEVEVRARVKGYLDSIGFKDGDDVTKGQLLFQIDPRPFEAQVKSAEGQVDQLKARRIKSDADVKRYRDLVPQGAATQQDLDRAIGELGEAEAAIRSAEADVERAKLDREYAKVTAPIDGMASRAILSVGNLIGAVGSGEQLLTTIVRMDPMHVYFAVDQRAAQVYRAAAMKRRAGGPEPKTAREMNIPFQFGLASEQGFPHEGVIDFIDNKIDPTTGTIAVRGEVRNEGRLFKPGYFARVRVAAGDKFQAVLVAERAIGTQQGQKYVLVVDDSNKVLFRPVQLGSAQGDGLRVVKSGLAAGERVVVNGIQRARPGSTVGPEVGEMVPRPTTRAVAVTGIADRQ